MKKVLLLIVSLIVGPNYAAEFVAGQTMLRNIKFPDGTQVQASLIEVDPVTKKTFLIEEGHAIESNDCRIRRTQVVLTGAEIRPLPPGVTETCIGKGCSHCVFKKGGGCKCKNSVNICEHTITRFNDTLED